MEDPATEQGKHLSTLLYGAGQGNITNYTGVHSASSVDGMGHWNISWYTTVYSFFHRAGQGGEHNNAAAHSFL